MLIPASVVLTVVGLAAAGIYWKTRPAYLDIRVRPPTPKSSSTVNPLNWSKVRRD
jgi:hypothetical protein